MVAGGVADDEVRLMQGTLRYPPQGWDNCGDPVFRLALSVRDGVIFGSPGRVNGLRYLPFKSHGFRVSVAAG
jgi:hypothetical protein